MTIKNLHQSVQWQDLCTLSKWQVVLNVLLPYPFLALAWWSALQFGTAQALMANVTYAGLALTGWFLFFASSFRQAHDGFHRTLGLKKTATDWLLWWSSGLIVSSNHAVRQTHLQHHRDPLAEDDLEARFHKLTWWQAILGGFGFYITLHTTGYRLAEIRKSKVKINEQHKILADLALMACVVIMAMVLAVMGFYILAIHVFVMIIANSFVGFVAGWCVHHDCNETSIARTERNRLVNLLTFNLLHHQEHHLFPSVPTNNLPQLAKRLDKSAPEMVGLRVLPTISRRKKIYCQWLEYRRKT